MFTRLFCLLTTALLLTVAAPASTIIYTGVRVVTTIGGGDASTQREALLLVLDSTTPRATLIVYARAQGGGFVISEQTELHNHYPYLISSTLDIGNGRDYLSLVGNTASSEGDTIYETLQLGGTLIHVPLYRDEASAIVRADVAPTLNGNGYSRFLDGEVHERQTRYQFRFHSFTYRFNSGSEEDFDEAVDYLNTLLLGPPSNP